MFLNPSEVIHGKSVLFTTKKLANQKKMCERVDLFAEHGFLQQHVDAHQLRVNGLEKAKLSVLNLTGHLVAGGRTEKLLSSISNREWKYEIAKPSHI